MLSIRPLLGLSPEVCVITTLHVWQEHYVKLHACMSVWVCGREKAHECAFVCVPPIVFLMWRDLAKRAAHRNWIWVKTRERWVTSLACPERTSLLWSSLWGIKKYENVSGKHMCGCLIFLWEMWLAHDPSQCMPPTSQHRGIQNSTCITQTFAKSLPVGTNNTWAKCLVGSGAEPPALGDCCFTLSL